LTNRLKERFIIVDALSIIDFEFSPEFGKAIEAKQVAEQNALKAQRDLERIKIEAEQRRTTAQAEADSLEYQKAQITPDLIRLRQLDVQKAFIEKWNGALPNFLMMGSEGNAGQFLFEMPTGAK
jgi:regulator of protease activity HflC (stomatin/prohibitin superfamily)